MFRHQFAAGEHVFLRALDIGRIRIGLHKSIETFVGFFQFCGCPVYGVELFHQGHACLVKHVWNCFVSWMKRFEILVRFRRKVIFLIKEIGIAKRKLGINRIRAEWILIPQLVIKFNSPHIIFFTHCFVCSFKDFLRGIFGGRQVKHIDYSTAGGCP